MKILLTGSTGFLGKYIYKSLIKNNKIDTLSRTKSSYNIDLSQQIPNFNESFNMVIHVAGKAHDQSKKSLINNSFYKVNVLGLKNLM